MSGSFTPEELASVGYNQQPTAPAAGEFTPEELAKVGYIKPIEQHAQTLQDMATGLVGGVAGQASQLLGQGIKNVGTLVGSQDMQDYGQSRLDNAQYLKGIGNQYSPQATEAGTIGADILGAAALPGESLPAIAASGAVAGLATSQGKTPGAILADTAESAVATAAVGKILDLGASVAAAVPTAKTALQNILLGSKAIATNSEQYADGAVSNALKMAGGDISKAEPEQVVQSMINYQKGLKNQASDMYAIRDAAADQAGIAVSKSNVQDLVTKMSADIATGSTPEMNQVLTVAKGIIGTTDAPIPFAKAEALSSKVSATIADAAAQGNAGLARQLGDVKDALQKDISTAAQGNSNVMQLHDAAQAFYKTSVAPLNNLNIQSQVMNKVTERQFIANMVRDLNKKPAVQAGFDTLSPNIKMNVLGSWLNIIRDSASETGELNMAKMSQAIETARVRSPDLFKATNSFDQMGALANVLKAHAEIIPKIRSVINPEIIGFTGGALLGHPVEGILGGLALPFSLHLYTAGKLLNNNSAKALLSSMGRLKNYPDSFIAKQTTDKIAKLYTNTALKVSKRALPVLMGAGFSNLK